MTMKTINISGISDTFSLGIAGTLSFGNGLKIRKLTDDIDDFKENSIEVAATDTLVALTCETTPPVVNGTIGDTIIVFKVNRYDNSIIIEDFCFGDSFSYDGKTESITTFSAWQSGDKYVYDEPTASFRLASTLESLDSSIQKYQKDTISAEIMTRSDGIDALFDTADIVFADYAVGDNQVDTWITANVSVSGLYMTFVESTDSEYLNEVTRVQLGSTDRNGKWDNKVYCGKRIIESKQLTPDSNDTKAIRYRFKADFNNNGKDDIEIQQLNILSTLKIFEKEGGDND